MLFEIPGRPADNERKCSPSTAAFNWSNRPKRARPCCPNNEALCRMEPKCAEVSEKRQHAAGQESLDFEGSTPQSSGNDIFEYFNKNDTSMICLRRPKFPPSPVIPSLSFSPLHPAHIEHLSGLGRCVCVACRHTQVNGLDGNRSDGANLIPGTWRARILESVCLCLQANGRRCECEQQQQQQQKRDQIKRHTDTQKHTHTELALVGNSIFNQRAGRGCAPAPVAAAATTAAQSRERVTREG